MGERRRRFLMTLLCLATLPCWLSWILPVPGSTASAVQEVGEVVQAGAKLEGASHVATVIPKVGLYITAEEIARARARIASDPWARELAKEVIARADQWVRRSDEWLLSLIPPRGSIFAYGISGCPVDGTPWPSFGGGGVASLDAPGVLYCPSGHLISFDDPNSPYYDDGRGVLINGVRYYLRGVWNAHVTNELAGWGNDRGAVHDLTHAYVLTGNPEYARKAILILDALATLSATTIGPRDFQRSETSDEGRLHWLTSIVHRSKMHLLRDYDLLYNTPWMHQVSRTNPDNYGRQKAGDFTVRENIEHNLLEDYLFTEFDLRNGNLTSLHNHEADAVRALLGVGIVLGQPDYIRWGMEAVGVFLDNTIDRDGMYYETSLSYTHFTKGVFLDMAEVAYHYDPARYRADLPAGDTAARGPVYPPHFRVTDPSAYPDRAQFPYNGNFFAHPKLQRLAVGWRQRVDAAGHLPAFGNAAPDWGQVYVSPGLPTDERLAAEKFLAYAPTEEERGRFAAMLLSAAGWNYRDDIGKPVTQETVERLNELLRRSRRDLWTLFHGVELDTQLVEAVLKAAAEVAASGEMEKGSSAFFGGTQLAILRGGTPLNQEAAVVRGGTSLPHAHDDVLGLNLYAFGMELTADIGYGTFGSAVHLGWGVRKAAHNLVVVNEDRNRNNNMFQIGPGSRVITFASLTPYAPASLVEMDAAANFQPVDGVQEYRRAVLQVDVRSARAADEPFTPVGAYWVDLFRLQGGSTYDYIFHTRASQLSLLDGTGERLKVAALPGVWTLAGLSQPEASWDAPGRSFGERIATGERITDLGIASEGVQPRNWTAPPKNGYGFIYDLKAVIQGEAETGQSEVVPAQIAPGHPVVARWELDDAYQTRVDLQLYGSRPLAIYQGTGPDLTGTRRLGFFIARSKASSAGESGNPSGAGSPARGDAPAETRYLAIIQAYQEGKPVVLSSQLLSLTGGEGSIGILLQLNPAMAGGRGRDWVVAQREGGGQVVAASPDLPQTLVTDGRWTLLREVDGSLVWAELIAGSKLAFGNWELRLTGPAARWRGKIVEVDYVNNRLVTDAKLPLGSVLSGLLVVVSNPEYTRDSAFTIVGVSRDEQGRSVIELGDSTLELARGQIDRIAFGGRLVTLRTPLPFAAEYGTGTRAYDGRLVRSLTSGAETVMVTVNDLKAVRLASASGFNAGDRIAIYEVQAGDTFVIDQCLAFGQTPGPEAEKGEGSWQYWRVRSTAGLAWAGELPGADDGRGKPCKWERWDSQAQVWVPVKRDETTKSWEVDWATVQQEGGRLLLRSR
ncbi:MAG: alginate lyase family protein [Limnochordales bacterium]|nr:alginate lyase family protein [Limnochordales bacterium]